MLNSTHKWLEPELMDVVRLFPSAEELVLSHSMEILPPAFSPAPACGGGVGEGVTSFLPPPSEGGRGVGSSSCGENSKLSPSPACGENSKLSPSPACGGGVGEGVPSFSPPPTEGGRGVGSLLVRNTIVLNGAAHTFEHALSFATETEEKSLLKRYAKLALYEVLSNHSQKNLPWGSLTGIRPTRLAYGELEKGRDFRSLFEELKVSEENTELVARVIEGQKGIYERREGNVDLYVSLPFCPSKCSYCSFITAPIGKTRQFVPAYLDALERELEGAKPLIKNLRSVYVGGGTPFVLDPPDLERVLKMLSPLIKEGVEYTVEAGRPDVFTPEKLDLCQKYGVTRICINAQSFSDRTLEAIGRKHTRAQLYEAFEMAKPYPFTVNCDLIAGLTGESVEEFRSSVEEAISLSPENITVHTLCLKKGAKLKEERLLPPPLEGGRGVGSSSCGENSKLSPAPACGGGVGEGATSFSPPPLGNLSTLPPPLEGGRGVGSPKNTLALLPDENLSEMISFSREALTKAGYEPYYLYRQKYMAGAHENVGWTKKGYASVYNIDVMEESADNLAIGSNAITKRVILSEGRIERLGSPKDIPSYLEKAEKLIQEKIKLFS